MNWVMFGRGLVALVVIVLALGHGAQPAAAHPLGNFSVNRYSRIEVGADIVRLRYVLDMAEIPAFQEMAQIDLDRDGTVSPTEQNGYLTRQRDIIVRQLSLSLNGAAVPLRPVQSDLSFPAGQGGLTTLRLVLDFEAIVPAGTRPVRAEYRDASYSDRIGWSEVVVQTTSGTGLLESSVPQTDLTDELRTYPEDMLASPLARREASFAFQPGALSVAPALNPIQATAGRAQDAFAALIATEQLGPGVVAISLLMALGLGAMHALSPGHGKTVVAAYLVGARGTARHALFLGTTVTITHTIGVFALGFITLFLSQYILPERLYPWLELISGLLVVTIGISLFGSRLRQAFRRPNTTTGHLLGSSQSTLTDQKSGADHSHDHKHDHDHQHDHQHDHDHQHGAAAEHRHGPLRHSHLPPGADGSPVGWRSLLALGVSGGLLPCPSALVVLLSAIALHRVAFGMLLIVAFSIGLAGVLTGIGLLLVYARRLFERFPTQGVVMRLAPVLSAGVIVLAGLAITLAALRQTGVI